ncbi:MAG TPA: ribbon-helix-helix protein, CopG family [Solirubrobacteraceae bacterium]
MSQQIAIRLPDEDLDRLDEVIAAGGYASRAAAVRAAIDMLLREEREREIADEYRRAYGEHPQEPWVGEAGLALGAEAIRQQRDTTDGPR